MGHISTIYVLPTGPALLIDMNRLSKRKAEVARFLRNILENPKAGVNQKLRAAERLDDLYRRHEEEQARLRERTTTSRQPEEATAALDSSPITELGQDNVESKIDRFLSTLRKEPVNG